MASFMLATTVCAEDSPTFQRLWQSASQNPDCKPAEYPDFFPVTCEKQLTLWYFTKPNHPAHPAVIKRVIYEENDAFLARGGALIRFGLCATSIQGMAGTDSRSRSSDEKRDRETKRRDGEMMNHRSLRSVIGITATPIYPLIYHARARNAFVIGLKCLSAPDALCR
jgi:hypothetical protein